MIDLGCGKGRLAKQFKELRPDINFVGLSAHEISSSTDYSESMDRVYYGKIPEDTRLLKDYKGRADVVIDTYGPMSFADNPVHVLIYALLLLNGTGIFSSITSETRKDQSQSVFGRK